MSDWTKIEVYMQKVAINLPFLLLQRCGRNMGLKRTSATSVYLLWSLWTCTQARVLLCKCFSPEISWFWILYSFIQLFCNSGVLSEPLSPVLQESSPYQSPDCSAQLLTCSHTSLSVTLITWNTFVLSTWKSLSWVVLLGSLLPWTLTWMNVDGHFMKHLQMCTAKTKLNSTKCETWFIYYTVK